jgi:hypothetical protein
MQLAAATVVQTAQLLADNDTNVVMETLGEADFVEWQHYPPGDAYDAGSFAQYYYHSHDGAAREHGHFHTFLRAGTFDAQMQPWEHGGADTMKWEKGEDALCHLVGVTMDHHGIPMELFTTNRWVTADCIYPAEDMIGMLDRFDFKNEQFSNDTNQWLTAMLHLFRPQIEALLRDRDDILRQHKATADKIGLDVFENRDLNIINQCPISLIEQMDWLGMLE